jgi:hypothetical protein
VRLSEDVMSLVNVPDPPRWFVLDAEASDDIRRELGRIGFTDKIGPDRYFRQPPGRTRGLLGLLTRYRRHCVPTDSRPAGGPLGLALRTAP